MALKRIEDEKTQLQSRLHSISDKIRRINSDDQSFKEMVEHYKEMIAVGIGKLNDFQSHHDYILKVYEELNSLIEKQELLKQLKDMEAKTAAIKEKLNGQNS